MKHGDTECPCEQLSTFLTPPVPQRCSMIHWMDLTQKHACINDHTLPHHHHFVVTLKWQNHAPPRIKWGISPKIVDATASSRQHNWPTTSQLAHIQRDSSNSLIVRVCIRLIFASFWGMKKRPTAIIRGGCIINHASNARRCQYNPRFYTQWANVSCRGAYWVHILIHLRWQMPRIRHILVHSLKTKRRNRHR